MTHNDNTLEYAAGPPPSWLHRVLRRPIGFPFYCLTIAASLFILWTARIPDSMSTAGAFVCLGAAFIAAYGARLCLFLLIGERDSHKWPRRSAVLRFLLVWIIPITTMILLQIDAPFRLAWWLSEPALEREALAIMAAPVPPGGVHDTSPRKLGFFTVQPWYDPPPNVVQFDISGHDGLDCQGIAYSTVSLPATDAEGGTYVHDHGRWYLFRTHGRP